MLVEMVVYIELLEQQIPAEVVEVVDLTETIIQIGLEEMVAQE